MESKVTYIWGELVSKQDIKRIKQLWGKRINKFFSEHYFNPGYNTGLESSVNIMSMIENDRQLNERDIALRSRIDQCIKKGKFTPSSGYYSTSVEDNLMSKLVQDALNKLNVGLPYNERIKGVSYNDLRRIYNLPLSNSTMKKVKEQEEKIGEIPKPVKIYALKHQYGNNHNDNSDTASCFKEYHIKGRLHSSSTFVRTGLPYVCKVYQSGHDYFQLYVYDFADRHYALHNAIHKLVTDGNVTLE